MNSFIFPFSFQNETFFVAVAVAVAVGIEMLTYGLLYVSTRFDVDVPGNKIFKESASTASGMSLKALIWVYPFMLDTILAY